MSDIVFSSSFTIIVSAALFMVYYIPKKNREIIAKNYPITLSEYLEKFPDCKTSKGIKCGYCGSMSIRNVGLRNHADVNRVVHCNSCSEFLYRKLETD